MKIAFCASEAVPFVKTGGLADVCGSLPKYYDDHEVVLFLPLYKEVDQVKFAIQDVNENISLTKIPNTDVKVYFVRNDKYFERDGLYGNCDGDYDDNLERFQFLSEKVLDSLKEINFRPDIIHCHDWHTSLIPVYLKELYKNDPFFEKTKSILSIHNIAFQGLFDKSKFSKLKVRDELFDITAFEFYNKINLLKAGIIYADRVSTVSPQHAKEIQTEELGCGLQGVLKHQTKDVYGILNGLDYEEWDPSMDRLVKYNFSETDWNEGKSQNKKYLQEQLGFMVNADIPLMGFVGRISEQKGLELIIQSLKSILELDVQVVIQGIGHHGYYDALDQLKAVYPTKLATCFDFNNPLAHQIYAGSDLFLMPSRFEPCGLSQLISMRYGTIPIVSRTGGLIDTVKVFDEKELLGNGFKLGEYTSDSLIATIREALKIFKNKSSFKRLVENALKTRFTWEGSVKKYLELYKT